MDTIKKIWFRPKEVSELTGLSLHKVRMIADLNQNKVRYGRGRTRKLHYSLVETLTKINL